MSGDERVLEVVRGWVEKAESDLKNATISLRAGPECPADTVAFHAQQCAEKYLKALLSYRRTEFPRIHDIESLLGLCRSGIRIDLSVEEQRLLTTYATITRYPGDYDPVSLTEARGALRLARRVRSAVRKKLPRQALKGRERQ
ncbi:MAG: HEPN domain-containing protein [Gemmatimonadetes bacterium]|nr:HEPN domain-containing protein [Gemmatimonadota bacterium]